MKKQFDMLYQFVISGNPDRLDIFNEFHVLYINIDEKFNEWKEFLSNYNDIEIFMKKVYEAKQDYIIHDFLNIKEEFNKEFYYMEHHKLSSYFIRKQSTINSFKNVYTNLEKYVKEWNKEYVKKQLVENKDLFNNIDGKFTRLSAKTSYSSR
ncbi:hypothetical protein [Vallitalea maricola]